MMASCWELADVINQFRHPLEQTHTLSAYKRGVLTLLQQCQTAKLGGHLWECPKCGHRHVSYNSCRNRHCPKCNGIKRMRWVEARKAEVMPGGYAHVVFTLPADLNSLCKKYPEKIYNLLFQSAWDTLALFAADHKHLGARSGMVALLHTWGQNLCLHPHLHCLVPMGGLTPNGKWKPARGKGRFLFPVKALSKVFRGKFTDGLYRMDRKSDIRLPDQIDLEQKHLHPLYRRKWVVFAKKPLPGGDKAVEYIGRYAYRVAIANSRIKEITHDKVTFTWVDYRHSKTHSTQLDGMEFLRRFTDHILPPGFVKIRHYGILSNRSKNISLEAVYQSIDREKPVKPDKLTWFELILQYYGKDPLLCPCCKKARLIRVAILPPQRAPPGSNMFFNTSFLNIA